jgi:hypothetical protein
MVEWVQTGKAWDPATLKQTGKEYDLWFLLIFLAG